MLEGPSGRKTGRRSTLRARDVEVRFPGNARVHDARNALAEQDDEVSEFGLGLRNVFPPRRVYRNLRDGHSLFYF